jgi:hypothetical protein
VVMLVVQVMDIANNLDYLGIHVISNSDNGQITSYCRKCL